MTIFVSELSSDWRDDGEQSAITYRIDTGDRVFDVFVRGKHLRRQEGLEPAVPLALLAGMRLGQDIHVKGSLSETFHKGVEGVIDLYARHFPGYSKVALTADRLYQASPVETGRRGAFFSGGVDSFFTLHKGQSRFTDLIYIHGFDVRLDDLERRSAIHRMGSSVAEAMGMRFLEFESNLGKVIQSFGEWPQHGHGLGLACIARSLSGELESVTIPGTHSIASQKPWGSWLETDPLFSDEKMGVEHDACEAERIDKLRVLAQFPLALRNLRVCWERVDGMYNCCRCEKCLRTMVSLQAFGVLHQGQAFPLPLDPARVAAVRLPREGLRIFPRENLEMLESQGLGDSPIAKALRRQLRRPIWWNLQVLKWRKRGRRIAAHWHRLLGSDGYAGRGS